MPKETNIKIYGDSIMRGTVMDENGRYHASMGSLLRPLEEKYTLKISNRSRFGLTVDKGKALIEKDLRENNTSKYALIEFGGNDCSFHWDKIAEDPSQDYPPLTERNIFIQTYLDIIKLLKKEGVTPVLMTLPPVDGERHLHFIGKTPKGRANILRWLGDSQTIYRFHELYSATVMQIAHQTGSFLIDARSYFLSNHSIKNLIGPDGVHLTPQGYGVLAQAIGDFIRGMQLGAKHGFA